MSRHRMTLASIATSFLVSTIVVFLCASAAIAGQAPVGQPGVASPDAPAAPDGALDDSPGEIVAIGSGLSPVEAVESTTPCATAVGEILLEPDPDGAAADYCPATRPEDDAAAAPGGPHRHGFCRCSCGYPCTTSADCGGVSCDPFITCC